MSAKDAFFQKLETNANAQKEGEEAFKRDVLAFQEDTKALIQEIIGWFAGSPVRGQFGYRKLLYVKEIFCTSELWQSLTTLTGSFEREADVIVCFYEVSHFGCPSFQYSSCKTAGLKHVTGFVE